MTKWVTVFCIVASVFAIATLIYVVGSIIRGSKKRVEERRCVCSRTTSSYSRNRGLLLLTGVVCAASGLLIGHVIAKDREKEKPSKFPFEK